MVVYCDNRSQLEDVVNNCLGATFPLCILLSHAWGSDAVLRSSRSMVA